MRAGIGATCIGFMLPFCRRNYGCFGRTGNSGNRFHEPKEIYALRRAVAIVAIFRPHTPPRGNAESTYNGLDQSKPEEWTMKAMGMTRILLAAGLAAGLGCGMALAQDAGQDIPHPSP